MRFPLRLSAALLKTKISTLLAGSPSSSPIFHMTPVEDGVACVKSTSALIVWIGGEEPLLHPEIGRVTNNLVEDKRRVFVHTDGYNLRQRIHLFRPDSRLFFALQFAGREETHNRAMGRPDAFRRSVEGIRAAKLSGFLVAAHFIVTSQTDPCEIAELIECLDNKNVDGFIVSSGGQTATSQKASLSEKLADVRGMIRSSRWENFSRLLEDSYANRDRANALEEVSAPDEGVYEEGD